MVEQALEQARVKYGFFVYGHVVMPEHVHLLVSEPERHPLATAIKAIKQSVARRQVKTGEHFWQGRYYDFNVGTPQKKVEKLKYIHRNPVHRGLVAQPEDWPWSSYRTTPRERLGLSRSNHRLRLGSGDRLITRTLSHSRRNEKPRSSFA
jgi:REP-associated tyrosine transposase